MIEKKRVLAVVPARGGSKGIPRKNIRNIAGKPLIAWTIEEAKKSAYIDRLILSSEDSEIIEVARTLGCEVPFIRPKHLAEDSTSGMDPVLHAINELPGYDFVLLLQPTSPFRTVKDIDFFLEKLIESGAPASVSVTIADKSPYWMYTLKDNEHLEPLLKQEQPYERRQDLPDVFVLNGAIYGAQINWLMRSKSFLDDKTTAFVMASERSYDIDTEEDFLFCEVMLNKKNDKLSSSNIISSTFTK